MIGSTGFGTAFAASIFTMIIQQHQPDFAFYLGTAGGIDARLQKNDVVIVEKAFEAEVQGLLSTVINTPFESCLVNPVNQQKIPDSYHGDKTLLEVARTLVVPDFRLFIGTMVTSNAFPAPVDLYQQIRSKAPLAIDMETSAIYQIVWLTKTPALAVRGISNVLNDKGQDEILDKAEIFNSVRNATIILFMIMDRLLADIDKQSVKPSLIPNRLKKFQDLGEAN